MRRTPPGRTIVAPPLRGGDRIGVCAPGGPVREAALDRGLAYLRGRGFETVEGRHLRARHAYLAGTDAERLADLQTLLSDPAIRAIWFARGGYGTGRILGALDLSPLRRAPKALIGYSDATVLQAACDRVLGLGSYYGPLVAELGDPAAFDEDSLWTALSADAAGRRDLEAASVARHGRGEGRLVGGCLSLLVGLVGTPYAPRTGGAVLFWEDVNEEPFRIDRMLGHLRLAGVLQGLRGMIVGRLIGCGGADPAAVLPLREILDTHLRGTDYPVVVDFPAGHCPAKVTLPLGRRVRLDTDPPRLTVLSAR
jgi:muramoyltetrapeptide carboxypeptidase